MTDIFDKAIAFVLAEEGGYVNDRYDPGGQTKYGISKASYPNVDIYNLTLEQAKNIYRKDYWEKSGGAIDDISPQVAIALMDTAVNLGLRTANIFLQQVIHTKADGIIGPMTRASLASCDLDQVLLDLLVARQLRYTELGTWHRYKRGWTRRVFRLMKYVTEENFNV